MAFLYKFFYPFIILFSLSAFLGSCRDNGDEDPIIAQNLEKYTSEDQREIGLRIKESIVSNSTDFPVLHRGSSLRMQEIYAYLNSLMTTLAINPLVNNRNVYDWNVTIIKDDERVDAFSVPGGHLFLYTGLLKYIETEHELMAIMAHELMYMDQKELIESLDDEFKGTTLGDIILHEEVAEMDEITFWLRDFEYSTETVMEADAFAVETICQFAYNAKGMKHFLERSTSDMNLNWLNRRPSAGNRIESISDLASGCGNEDKLYEARYQSMIEKLP